MVVELSFFRMKLALINLVLNPLPFYYLSIFQAPKGVITKLQQLQRTFLWGGGTDKRAILKVKWSVAHSPERFRGPVYQIFTRKILHFLAKGGGIMGWRKMLYGGV